MAMRDLTGAVDFTYLEGYMQGDVTIIEEVLRLFQHQCEMWSQMLTIDHEGWRDAAHTLKGAALGIGANQLASVAAEAETGDAEGGAGRLERVRSEMNLTLLDVAAYLHGLQLRGLKS